MDFFCLPILFGCSTRTNPDTQRDQTPRVCPRCHNVSVIPAKSRMWFELFCVPIIPMNSKHLWICTICQWSVNQQQGWEPAIPQGGYQHDGQQNIQPGTPPQGWQQGPSQHQPGYNPSYQPQGQQQGYLNQHKG